MAQRWKTLDNKCIVVTGAASGMGLAVTEQLLAAGARVAASDVNSDQLNRLRTLAPEARLLLTVVDVADRGAMLAWAEQVKNTFGAVDGLINNAGVALVALASAQPREEFEWLFNINFWGVVNGCEAFLPLLEQSSSARVVNLSSVFGLIALPTQSAYNAAKFAVRGYSEALRHELAEQNIAVTTVHPGGVKTNIARDGHHLTSMDGGEADLSKVAAQFDAMAATTAEKAGSLIVNAMMRGQPRLLIGADARVIDWVSRWFPVRYDWLLGAVRRRLLK